MGWRHVVATIGTLVILTPLATITWAVFTGDWHHFWFLFSALVIAALTLMGVVIALTLVLGMWLWATGAH